MQAIELETTISPQGAIVLPADCKALYGRHARIILLLADDPETAGPARRRRNLPARSGSLAMSCLPFLPPSGESRNDRIHPTRRNDMMQAYKTYARIQATGDLAIAHLPFAPGSLVEVLVVGAERGAAEREQEWARMMQTVQALPQSPTISDADIATEIDASRSGL